MLSWRIRHGAAIEPGQVAIVRFYLYRLPIVLTVKLNGDVVAGMNEATRFPLRLHNVVSTRPSPCCSQVGRFGQRSRRSSVLSGVCRRG